MGMDRKVTFPKEKTPSWSALVQALAAQGVPLEMRMIDGQLAFPDEAPPDDWRELRLGTPGGMVTLRRDGPRAVLLVTWGNADEALRQAWHAATWACAEATGGRVQTPAGPVSAADFKRAAELPPPLRD